MLNAAQRTFTPGQVVQYGDGWKAFVLAPACAAGFLPVENIYDDDGRFAIVAERDLEPAELDADELYMCGLAGDRPVGLDINLVERS
ncbi:hypothetical protein EN868_03225 [Mesorhizobium sp. M2D.F.Ca.ET.225.01.1.1]|uniref:hypothetical protein n=1 Tax=unclassified Mesorhizobium TaxID=325217 RepID=UPI000FD37EBA|nr:MULTISPECIES: hypothetical protein [unclassified Mesorhizobium]TGP65472.1 hypothetical protein EN869_003230 [Mesorhizobium sp. M2D.F.Ca.ET.226.01.1.1]TGP71951.1 hypothetical protein EN868_03225 [Mesorhizobium sp. M2D.F.Ca.ET.225.01.1.1]